MSRLDKDRQQKLEPIRMEFARKQITDLGYEILVEDETSLLFMFKKHTVKFFPYSGWATGRKIKDGRGLAALLEQIKP